jgi:lysophospholipase L1-like esterase
VIHKNIEFHNVSELEQIQGLPGLALQRFPASVRHRLGHSTHERGRVVSQVSAGCELRFVTDADTIKVWLSALQEGGDVLIYKGDFFHSTHRLMPGIITTIQLETPARFREVTPQMLEGSSFSSNIWRIMISNGYTAVFHGIDSLGHDVRPPHKLEVPKVRWLAYGSSITYGAGTTLHHNSYIQQAARRLNVDVMCNGLGGACLCEPTVADFLATREDWDFVTLELGVNMRNMFTPEEFEKRVRYLVGIILEKNPGKPVILITIYPNYAEYLVRENHMVTLRDREYNDVLRRLVTENPSLDLHLIEGDEILTSPSGLCSDLLHPSDFGHILMGQNLAEKLRDIIYAHQGEISS